MAKFWKHRNAATAVTAVVVLALLGTLSVALANGDEGHEFIGSSKCKMCHKDVFKSWEGTPHSKAFDVLKAGERAEAKTKYNLDPAKDYTADENCLGCHTTGYGKSGGYAVPAAGDEKAAKKMAKLAGVGCESCHGAGQEYSKLHKTIKKEKRTYTNEEMYQAGMNKIEEATCTGCHNDKSPTFDAGNPFDFNKMSQDKAGMHAHEELELRQD
jgi:hypothetical protein